MAINVSVPLVIHDRSPIVQTCKTKRIVAFHVILNPSPFNYQTGQNITKGNCNAVKATILADRCPEEDKMKHNKNKRLVSYNF